MEHTTAFLPTPIGHCPGRRQVRHAHDLRYVRIFFRKDSPDAITKHAVNASAWFNPSGFAKTESYGRDAPEEVAPRVSESVVGKARSSM